VENAPSRLPFPFRQYVAAQEFAVAAKQNPRAALMHRVWESCSCGSLARNGSLTTLNPPFRRRRKLNARLIVSLKTVPTSGHRSTQQGLRAEPQKLRRSDRLRRLLIGALGLSLTSCSHSPPSPTTAASCREGDGLTHYDRNAASPPLKLVSFRTRPVTTRAKSSHAAKSKPPPHQADDGRGAKTTTPTVSAAKRENVPSRIPLSLPSPSTPEPTMRRTPEAAITAAVPTAPDTAGSVPAERQAMPPAPRSIRELVAAATIDAEKSIPPMSADDADRLVAVLMTRLNVTSVSDLTSKSIAIDALYSVSAAEIRTAIVAAGATEVELSETTTLAIDRLASGEVPAALVALVSPEAAATFPEVSGFRTFRVPVSPRSLEQHP
jgi:hypothetical protein